MTRSHTSYQLRRSDRDRDRPPPYQPEELLKSRERIPRPVPCERAGAAVSFFQLAQPEHPILLSDYSKPNTATSANRVPPPPTSAPFTLASSRSGAKEAHGDDCDHERLAPPRGFTHLLRRFVHNGARDIEMDGERERDRDRDKDRDRTPAKRASADNLYPSSTSRLHVCHDASRLRNRDADYNPPPKPPPPKRAEYRRGVSIYIGIILVLPILGPMVIRGFRRGVWEPWGGVYIMVTLEM
ncbi:hypothetical protein BT96DRAFT_951697 [Gymnopus androsaceus JB14]|uniref:Uncharacterized protein n=1 Tax=Gymnopus androsaceus JB14 TaxID=1447944 RepID=A0A6A4GC02_9AGAR|nr:hypothetical protein BT96DRAFT_951697 [Gymnopus androsaceus JB14]